VRSWSARLPQSGRIRDTPRPPGGTGTGSPGIPFDRPGGTVNGDPRGPRGRSAPQAPAAHLVAAKGSVRRLRHPSRCPGHPLGRGAGGWIRLAAGSAKGGHSARPAASRESRGKPRRGASRITGQVRPSTSSTPGRRGAGTRARAAATRRLCLPANGSCLQLPWAVMDEHEVPCTCGHVRPPPGEEARASELTRGWCRMSSRRSATPPT
jgi:hypothetical protein